MYSEEARAKTFSLNLINIGHILERSMLVSHRFGLRRSSERTVEFNVLNEMAAYLWSVFGLTLTVISPTQAEEDRLGFDDIMEGLPLGQLIAVQFKRPKEMKRPKNAVRFTLDTLQLNCLASNFSRHQAYVFLAPFPTNQQVVRYRRRLLTMTVALDVFDIPNLYKTKQKTRTARVYTYVTLTRAPRLEIADPRKYQPISKTSTAAELCELVGKSDVGYRITSNEVKPDQPRKIGIRKLYYLHVAKLHEFADSPESSRI